MTTLVRADEKGRICIRGARKGDEFLVKAEGSGWWISPVPKVSGKKTKPRDWPGPRVPLVEHLTRLAKNGLTLERSKIAMQKVPKCRF